MFIPVEIDVVCTNVPALFGLDLTDKQLLTPFIVTIVFVLRMLKKLEADRPL